MANPSTIWAQLALPNPPAGSVPYVLSDGATIGTDVLNFFYDPNLTILHIKQGIAQFGIIQTGVVGPVTPYSAGRVTLRAGQSSLVFTCTPAVSGDLLSINPRSLDATATRIIGAVTGPSQITITANAAATAAVDVEFIVIHLDAKAS